MNRKAIVQIPIISNDIAIACSHLNQKMYENPCFQELLNLIKDEEFNRNYNYAIYTDEMSVKENLFIPRFHTYYLQSKTKDVILLDKESLTIAEVYGHHRFYIYNNKQLLDTFKRYYENINITHIQSIKDINNVPESE